MSNTFFEKSFDFAAEVSFVAKGFQATFDLRFMNQILPA